MTGFSFCPRIGYVKDIANGWMPEPYCLFSLCWGLGVNGISILSRIFLGRKPFALYCLYFFHLFLFLSQRHESHLYLEEMLLMKLTFEFVSLTLSFFISFGPITLLLSCIRRLQPRYKHPRFCSFLITSTAFHIIFVRLTCPMAHVMRLHNFHRLDGGLARVNCDLECSQRRPQVVLSLTGWVAIQ